MKIFKLVLPLLIILALALPCHAMHLPEKNVLNKEITVEKDSSIIKDAINGDKDKPEAQAKTFLMSNAVYIKRIVIPFFALFLSGPLILLAEHLLRKRKKSQPK